MEILARLLGRRRTQCMECVIAIIDRLVDPRSSVDVYVTRNMAIFCHIATSIKLQRLF